MAIHSQAFREELYVEHLEEAAFQYETRCVWLHDEEIGWQELDEVDAILDAHIDGILVGGSLGLKVCLESIEDADASALHIIVRVFCRHQLFDRLSHFWTLFDFEDEEKVAAVVDALKWECPTEWLSHLLSLLAKEKRDMYALLAPVIAKNSPQSAEVLLQTLSSSKPENIEVIIDSLAYCQRSNQSQSACANILAPYIKHENEDVAEAAVFALMMMGEGRVLTQCLPEAGEVPMPINFALGGDVLATQKMVAQAQAGTATEETLIALGLTGDLSAVPHLLAYLKHPDYAPIAAQALQLISGADLFEHEHVEEPVDKEELFERELEAYNKGELPKNIDGNPFGVEVCKLSTKKDTWFDWLQKNKQNFVKGMRYRNGKPYSPLELFNNILNNQAGFEFRKYAYQELVIRYGMDVPFAADDLIEKQKVQINAIHTWVQQNHARFTPGAWYFNGEKR